VGGRAHQGVLNGRRYVRSSLGCLVEEGRRAESAWFNLALIYAPVHGRAHHGVFRWQGIAGETAGWRHGLLRLRRANGKPLSGFPRRSVGDASRSQSGSLSGSGAGREESPVVRRRARALRASGKGLAAAGAVSTMVACRRAHALKRDAGALVRRKGNGQSSGAQQCSDRAVFHGLRTRLLAAFRVEYPNE
jgi:hypothetical protein